MGKDTWEIYVSSFQFYCISKTAIFKKCKYFKRYWVGEKVNITSTLGFEP